LKKADKLFRDFSGHEIEWKENAPDLGTGVWIEIGSCDYLEMKNKDGIKEYIPIHNSRLLVRDDGKQFAVMKKGIATKINKFLSRLDVSTYAPVSAIGYTTKRENEVIRYNHDFTEFAAPQISCFGSDILKSVRGRFEFTDLGFTDNKKA